MKNDFYPLGRDADNTENRTGLWFCPRLDRTPDGHVLRTRSYATAESVTGGVALRVEIGEGSRGILTYENSPFPSGSAGITLYVKASENLTMTLQDRVTFPATPAWRKIDIPWERLGTHADKPTLPSDFLIGLAAPARRDAWVILDRLGTEGPAFASSPPLSPAGGPDETIRTSEIVGNTAVLAPTVARLRAKKPFKIVAFGDSVTAGAQSFRGNWDLRETGARYLYFSELSRLLEAHYGYKGITPVQEGHGGWTAARAKTIIANVVEGIGPDDLLILEFGANDLGWAGESVESWLANLRALIAAARPRTTQILVTTPTVGGKVPEHAAEVRRRIPAFARTERVAYMDITHWSLYRGEKFAWAQLANEHHPSFAGHRMIAELLLPLFTDEHFLWPPYAVPAGRGGSTQIR